MPALILSAVLLAAPAPLPPRKPAPPFEAGTYHVHWLPNGASYEMHFGADGSYSAALLKDGKPESLPSYAGAWRVDRGALLIREIYLLNASSPWVTHRLTLGGRLKIAWPGGQQSTFVRP